MVSEEVTDATAEKLEASGLWRRAAIRWLNIMQRPELTDLQREWVRQRRAFCQENIAPTGAPEKLDIMEISRAASATQTRMGLARPNGAMFRTYPGVKKPRAS